MEESELSGQKKPTHPRKKMVKQLTGKRDDTALHSAARAGDIAAARELFARSAESGELRELLRKQNQSGETALYVAAEYGYVDLVREMIEHYDLVDAEIKAKNGFDAFHIASKQGDLEVLKVLIEVHPELAMTVDLSNTTALHTAATQGLIEVVKLLLEVASGLTAIAKSNGKTAVHSAARNGHLEVVKMLLAVDPGIVTRTDKKGQTALHMAAKGQSVEVVRELIEADNSTVNMVDNKGNSALHIASRKARGEIVKVLLQCPEINTKAVNRAGETALDTAEKMDNPETAAILQEHGVPNARSMKSLPPTTPRTRQLKQTVSDIKHEVHNQLEHTRLTRRHVKGIAKRLNKIHSDGLNNAINSATVVAVLIATVAFAAIFTVPGQYADDPADIPNGLSLGEANISPNPAFIVFFVFDSIALFISLAVVVVQTSVVVIERKAKKQMMAVINKLMWLGCVFISVAFIALSYVVVGPEEQWLAISVTIIGTIIMVATLSTMSYWVIRHRIEASNMRNIKGSGKSRSWSMSVFSDSDILNSEYNKTMYAI